MSISGGALILFTMLVRSVALDKLPKKTFFILWGVSALRLLLPVSVPSPFSVFTQTERALCSLKPETPIMEFVQILIPVNGQVSAAQTTRTAPVPILTIIWLSGATLLAAYFTIIYISSLRRFNTSLPEKNPFVQDWLAQHQSLRPVQVRQSDRIVSPLTYGILRPVILLPKSMDHSNESVLNCVLTHEYIHIRRFDAVTKLILAAVLCIHWFNPLVWVMYCLANRDLELICDEQVLRELGSQGRRPYVLTLLEMEESKQKNAALFSHFGKLAMQERIEAIINYKKKSFFTFFLALLLVSGATTVFATSPAGDDNFQTASNTQPSVVEDSESRDSGADDITKTAPTPQPSTSTNKDEAFPEALSLTSGNGVIMYAGYMSFEEFRQTGLAERIGFQPEVGGKIFASAVYYINGLGDEAPSDFPAEMCCLTVDFYETETFGRLWRGIYMAEFTTIDPDEFAQGWMDFLSTLPATLPL